MSAFPLPPQVAENVLRQITAAQAAGQLKQVAVLVAHWQESRGQMSKNIFF